jgi:hypothetical protein
MSDLEKLLDAGVDVVLRKTKIGFYQAIAMKVAVDIDAISELAVANDYDPHLALGCLTRRAMRGRGAPSPEERFISILENNLEELIEGAKH